MSRRATVPASASTRAAASTLGVALLVLLAVGLAGAVAVSLATVTPADPPPRAALALTVEPGTDRLAVTHLAGDPLDVRELRVRVFVDGTPLTHQPPVPFFAATGFRAGPTGPFNSAADPTWLPGETASVRLASTNQPALEPGARVRVDVSTGEFRIARLVAEAG